MAQQQHIIILGMKARAHITHIQSSSLYVPFIHIIITPLLCTHVAQCQITYFAQQLHCIDVHKWSTKSADIKMNASISV